MFRALIFVVACSTLYLTGCPKKCEPKTARCLGGTVQLCRPDGKWQSVVNCGRVVPSALECACADKTKCACKPATKKGN